MMGDLLKKVGATVSKRPMILEFEVPKDTFPYLITSRTGFIWIEKPHRMVRSMVKQGSFSDDVYSIVVKMILERSISGEWGNHFSNDEKGIELGKEYLKYYEIEDVEVLDSNNSKWIPDGCAVVVPKDRDFIGSVVLFNGYWTCVVHNSARSIAVLGPWNPPDPG